MFPFPRLNERTDHPRAIVQEPEPEQNVLFSQNQTIPQKPLELAIKPSFIVKSAKTG
jgi:hypothetical protein